MELIDRTNRKSTEVGDLRGALAVSIEKADQLELLRLGLEAELTDARTEVEAGRRKIAELEASLENLKEEYEAKLQGEAKRADETEEKLEAECDAAFQDANTQATAYCKTVVISVRDKS